MKFCCECGRELKEDEVCNCIDRINKKTSDEELPKGVFDNEVRFGLLSNEECERIMRDNKYKNCEKDID